jgi:hypothetical protein
VQGYNAQVGFIPQVKAGFVVLTATEGPTIPQLIDLMYSFISGPLIQVPTCTNSPCLRNTGWERNPLRMTSRKGPFPSGLTC